MKSKLISLTLGVAFMLNVASYSQEVTNPPNNNISQQPNNFRPPQDQIKPPQNQLQPINPNPNQMPINPNQNQMNPNGMPPNPNGMPPNPNGMPPNPNGMPPNPNRMPPNQNQMPPNPNQMPPNLNQIPPNQNKMPPNPNQMSPNPNQMSPNLNQMPVKPNQTPVNPNQMPVNPNQMPPNSNQMPVNPNQMPVNPNQMSPNPNQNQMNPNRKPPNPNQINPNQDQNNLTGPRMGSNDMFKEGRFDPQSPNFNPFDPEYRPDNPKSVFKDVYGQFFRVGIPGDKDSIRNGNSVNKRQDFESNSVRSSVYKSVYKFEDNFSKLYQDRPNNELPKFNNNKEQIADMISKINEFQDERDQQYAKMIQVMDVIDQVKEENIKKQLLFEFQKVLEQQTKIDKQGYGRIEAAFRLINKNFATIEDVEKEKIKEELKLIIEKYQKQKGVLKVIHDRFRSLKNTILKDSIQLLLEKAQELSQNGQQESAAKYYEKAIYMDQENPDLIKQAGAALNNAEGAGPKVFVKGQRPEFDVKPTIVNGRTLVPLRAIANALGITNENIKYDGQTKTITLIKGDNEVRLTIGKPSVTINGEEKPIDVPAMIIDGRTLVPARVVSEALDAKVNYEPTSQIITIDDNITSNASSGSNIDIEALSKETNADISQNTPSEEQILDEYLKQ